MSSNFFIYYCIVSWFAVKNFELITAYIKDQKKHDTK